MNRTNFYFSNKRIEMMEYHFSTKRFLHKFIENKLVLKEKLTTIAFYNVENFYSKSSKSETFLPGNFAKWKDVRYENKVDKIIKSGKTLQNISLDSNKGVEQAFYASMHNRDNTKYRGIYGTQLGRDGVYETKIKTIRNIKIASKESAKNSFRDLGKCSKR